MPGLDRGRWEAIDPLLDRALEISVHERGAWLDALRAEEPALAAELHALLALRADADRDRFLEFVPVLPPASLAGQTIGAYTLEEPIGQGGMGAVWLARRSDGRFEGRAAVKLLNLSLVGQAGEERFRREGTILARFTHPHIARLIDAGVSRSGQPYLVLEHVAGEPIDRFCAAHELGIEERLRLFLSVLEAVAHAHANLIVHRDIKPSNVLVNDDGRVKLLDFGIAKLLQDETAGGEVTALTRDGGSALTLEYAAPEQVTGGAVTTATDVYSLGILLYVLLSGRHPAERALGSPADLLMAIVEAEPSRVSESAPQDRRRVLRGDLDTIVAKALKKNPDERYGAVSALADDLRRFLEKKPIAARRDSLRYRATKFVRRHSGGVAVTGVVALLLAGLVGFYTARLARERDRARLQAEKATKVSELLTDLFTGADPFTEHRDKEPTVHELLDAGAERVQKELAQQPELEVEMLAAIGKTYQRLGLHDRAEAVLRTGVAIGRRSFPGTERLAENLNNLGVLIRRKGALTAASPLLEEALAIRRKVLAPDDEKVAITLVELGRVYGDLDRDDLAEPLLREALAIRRRVLGTEDHNIAVSLGDLGFFRKASGPEHPDVASTLFQLAQLAADRGDYEASERLFRHCVAIDGRTLGEGHPDYAYDLVHFSRTLLGLGKYDEAAADAELGIRITAMSSGKDHPLIAFGEIYLAEVHLARNEASLAEPLLRDALRIRQHTFRPDDWRIGVPKSVLGATLTALGRYDEAEPLLRDAHRVIKDVPGVPAQEAEATRARLTALAAARARSAGP
jgi:serine/threonine protein kinase